MIYDLKFKNYIKGFDLKSFGMELENDNSVLVNYKNR